METGNDVARLNEYVQKTGSRLQYEDLGSVGPAHVKTFTQRVVLNGKDYPNGVGKTKKEAKQNAAKIALRDLFGSKQKDSVDTTGNTAEAPTAPVHQTSITQSNYTCWLNEYGHKNRLIIRAVESTQPGPYAIPCCSFVVGEKEYPAATGQTRKEAKEEAAKLVYQEISGSKTTETAAAQQQEEQNQNVSDICNETRRLSLNFKDNSFTETNYIGIVNHYCQKKNLSHKFFEERRCGPSHNPQFFYKLIIDNKDYPVGEGKSAKEAKQNAARLAWSALEEQTDWDSKVSVRSTASEGGGPSPSTTLASRQSSSQSMPTDTSDSIIFTDPSNPSKAQMPLRSTVAEEDAPTSWSTSLESLASSQSMSMGTSGSGIFTDSSNSSKDQHAAKDQNMGNIQNETSVRSRFTSEFDSIKRLGSGGFGRVYKARYKLLNKHYAVKIVYCAEKALREVGTLSDLLHCNIVRYYTFWMEDSEYKSNESTDGSTGSYGSSQSKDNSSAKYLYIQMELCDTKTLKVWIDEKNAQSLQDSKRREESLSIARQIVSGVEYIHSKKHIHRDLKPENILFGLDGEVKIGDFGLVTRDDDDDALVERTENRGTPSYMAPEQREKTYDRKVDIFALGLIYLELLWKVSSGHERAEIFRNARRQMLPKDFLQTFPQENQIIKLMLREKSEERPGASKLKAELEKWAQTFNAQNEHHRNATI
ncbi:interferon-induced, double-stranded RNA-activated protein kinase-like isoform X1 [Sebastes fasciatus]|uniref:interferon-induced, double-stranded RNA-activated protein kinase-like isoform X1 n=1 Tax=Sebastes fasciatus TaxID=394691 RepID=UPI003D9E1973